MKWQHNDIILLFVIIVLWDTQIYGFPKHKDSTDEVKALLLVRRALVTASRKVNKNFIKRRQHLYKTFLTGHNDTNSNNDKNNSVRSDNNGDHQQPLYTTFVSGHNKSSNYNSISRRQHLYIPDISPNVNIQLKSSLETPTSRRSDMGLKMAESGIVGGRFNQYVQMINNNEILDNDTPEIHHVDMPQQQVEFNQPMEIQHQPHEPITNVDYVPVLPSHPHHNLPVTHPAESPNIHTEEVPHLVKPAVFKPNFHTQPSTEDLLHQAMNLKLKAYALEKQAEAPHIPENNLKILQDLVNVDKAVHIKSGYNGKGPERGGTGGLPVKAYPGVASPMGMTSDLLDNKDGTLIKQIDTGYPEYYVPTKPLDDYVKPELVRPLPPEHGVNPYEVLTSSSLQKWPGTTSQTLDNNVLSLSSQAKAAGGTPPIIGAQGALPPANKMKIFITKMSNHKNKQTKSEKRNLSEKTKHHHKDRKGRLQKQKRKAK